MIWLTTFFSFLLLGAACAVLLSENPVHSVLFLVLTFCSGSVLLFCVGAEYLAFVYVIVYMGAIAVLFLFIVMMLNIESVPQDYDYYQQYLPIPIFVLLFFMIELITFTKDREVALLMVQNISWLALMNPINIVVFGRLFYTDYLHVFISVSFILLIAMIGSITLTLNFRPGVKRQIISKQLSRDFSKAIVLKR